MNIAIVCDTVLPVRSYGGTERVVWDLAAALADSGHKVTLMAAPGTRCAFAEVVCIDPGIPFSRQLPQDIDVLHFNNTCEFDDLNVPHIVTIHGNPAPGAKLDPNSVFVSADHARRYGSREYVHNGLDWNRYPQADIHQNRDRLHFLGKGAWSVKNMKGAIETARLAGFPIDILGAHRVSLKMGVKVTLDRNACFHGMVTDKDKAQIIPQSRGLVFPVKWPEPFGLAITESLWYGAPLYGTPYGSLPELVGDNGYLSANSEDLAMAIKEGVGLEPDKCRQYAGDLFSAEVMARGYLSKYERVVSGESLNPTPPTLSAEAPTEFPWK